MSDRDLDKNDSCSYGYKFRKFAIAPPEKFFFTKAEELIVDSFAALPTKWIEFIARSVKMRRLHINRHDLGNATLDGLNSIAVYPIMRPTKLCFNL